MMSIGDANDVQLVLRRLYRAEPGAEPVPLSLVEAAVARLADRSARVLGAGRSAGDFSGRMLR